MSEIENVSTDVLTIIDTHLDCLKQLKKALDEASSLLRREIDEMARSEITNANALDISEITSKTNELHLQATQNPPNLESNGPKSIKHEHNIIEAANVSELPSQQLEIVKEPLEDDLFDNYKDYIFVSQESIASSSNPFHKIHWFYATSQEGLQDTFYYPFVLHPHSNGVKIWNAICNFSILCFLVLLPLFATVPQYSSYQEVLSPLIMIVVFPSLVIDLNTATYMADSLVTDRKSILVRQLKTGKLLIDLIATFPWAYIGRNHDYLCLLHGMCIFRLFQSKETYFYMSATKIKQHFKIDKTLVVALQILFFQLLYWHWAVAAKWIIWKDLLTNDIFSICGKIFAYKTEEVNNFSNLKGFGTKFRSRLVKYYQSKFPQGKYFDQQNIKSLMNEPLLKYISVREAQSLILKVPFFRDGDTQFIGELATVLANETFIEGDMICEEGEWGDKMYFVIMGKIEVVAANRKKLELSPGSYFGGVFSVLDDLLEQNLAMKKKIHKVAQDKLVADKKYYEDQKRREAKLNSSTTRSFKYSAMNDEIGTFSSGSNPITSSLSPGNIGIVYNNMAIKNSIPSSLPKDGIMHASPDNYNPLALQTEIESKREEKEVHSAEDRFGRRQSILVYADTKPILVADSVGVLSSILEGSDSSTKDLHTQNVSTSNVTHKSYTPLLNIPRNSGKDLPYVEKAQPGLNRSDSIYSYIKYDAEIQMEKSFSASSKISNEDSFYKNIHLTSDTALKKSNTLHPDTHTFPEKRARRQTIIKYGNGEGPNFIFEVLGDEHEPNESE
ncbi:anaphase-promoting complex subunit Hcn1 [Boothiomyces sp. JEL0866]|nr:anaphase-promoting complex subunit Hcn1 [Boothiomyces sp. JEL0866]